MNISIEQAVNYRFGEFHGTLLNSNLTMVHDIAGEVSPDVSETFKEKKNIAKNLAIKLVTLEMDSLKGNWFGKYFFSKRIAFLEKVRSELHNS